MMRFRFPSPSSEQWQKMIDQLQAKLGRKLTRKEHKELHDRALRQLENQPARKGKLRQKQAYQQTAIKGVSAIPGRFAASSSWQWNDAGKDSCQIFTDSGKSPDKTD